MEQLFGVKRGVEKRGNVKEMRTKKQRQMLNKLTNDAIIEKDLAAE